MRHRWHVHSVANLNRCGFGNRAVVRLSRTDRHVACRSIASQTRSDRFAIRNMWLVAEVHHKRCQNCMYSGTCGFLQYCVTSIVRMCWASSCVLATVVHHVMSFWNSSPVPCHSTKLRCCCRSQPCKPRQQSELGNTAATGLGSAVT